MLKIKFIRNLSFIVLLSSALAACTSNDELERVSDLSPQARYEAAKDLINSELYNRAITILNDLENQFPYGPLSRQVQLDLLFALYKSGRYEEALPAIDRFIKLNPSHPRLDFVMYIRGLVNMEKGINSFQEFFGLSNADKDLEATRDAFADFKKVIQRFPDSLYVEDSKSRMVQVLNRLAKYELHVAEYYMSRSAYIAAVSRCKYVLEYYKDSTAVVPALKMMIDAYDKLGLTELKQEVELVLAANTAS